MLQFKNLLANLHYLNHPYLSGLSALCILSEGIFVLSKNRKSELYQTFFWMAFVLSLWFFGNALSMSYFNNFELAFFWYRLGYTGVPFMSVVYYHFYLAYVKKKKKIIYFLYIVCILEILYLWLSNDARIGAYTLPNVGIVWQGMLPFFYFLAFGMIKYIILSSITAFSFLSEYKKATASVKKQQLKYLTIIFFNASLGTIEWLPAFDIPLHIAWLLMPIFIGLVAYAIIKYRLMDIQVVFSRTLAIVILLITLACVHIGLFKLSEPIIGSTPAILLSFLLIVLICFATPLRHYLQALTNRLIIKGKYDYQEILKEASRAVVTKLDLEELLNYLIDVIRSSLGVGRLALLMKGGEGNYTVRWGDGIDKGLLGRYTVRNGVIDWIKQKKEIFIKDEQQMALSQERFLNLYQDMEKINAEVVVPLFYKGQLEGLLTLDHKATKAPYVQSDIDLLEALASQAIIAIKNAQLYEEAITDSLTGLYHHKYFSLRLIEEIERAKRYQHPLSLLMLDLDHFKEVNDRYGHQLGDEILKKIASIFKTKTRRVDIVARYGGEEFAIILPETGLSGAQTLAARLNIHLQEAVLVADRLRKSIEQEEFITPEGERIKLTLSIGISYFTGEDKEFSPPEMIKRADTALYQAKQSGRNRTEVWEEKGQI